MARTLLTEDQESRNGRKLHVAGETTLYLVRHGETEQNRLGTVQGRGVDGVLNETGRRQATCLADHLSRLAFDAAYASTLRRARETAEIVLSRQVRAPQLQQIADLDEMCWGEFEGRPFRPPVSDAISRLREDWQAGRFDKGPKDGESIVEVQERSVRAVRNLVDAHPGQTILVVTHGRLLRILLASLLPEFGLPRMEELPHDNTGVNVVAFAGQSVQARALNNTDHLTHEMALR